MIYTLKSIQQLNLTDYLAILSTDSEDYAQLAQQQDFYVPFIRPKELATDHTSALAVVNHALDWFEYTYQYLPEQILWLQPTSPFRSTGLIEQALAMIENPAIESVIGCKTIDRDLTTLFKSDNGFLKPLSKQTTQTCRQHIEPLLTPNGALYLCKTAVLRAGQSFYSSRSVALPMDAIMSLDIDNDTDWLIAEALCQYRSHKDN